MNLFGTSPKRVGWLVILVLGMGAQPDSQAHADSQELGRARGLLVEEVRNENPAFMVRVDVDHPKRIYRRGEVMQVRVVSGVDGFLYVFYVDAQGTLIKLFPNQSL